MTINQISQVHNIPIRFTESLDSFQPIPVELHTPHFDLALDECYVALSLKNGGFIISDRTGVGSTFAIKNIISGIQKRRLDQGMEPLTFVTIDNQIVDLCGFKQVSLGEYIEGIIDKVDKGHPENLVLVSESYAIGDKLAQLAPTMGFKTILEISDADFRGIFQNPRTINITKRMATGWIVGGSPFLQISKEHLIPVVTEMVNYGLQGNNLTVNHAEVSRLIGLLEELVEEDEEFRVLRESLNEGIPQLEGTELLFPAGICAQFIQLFKVLTSTSTSEEYAFTEDYGDEDSFDKEILRRVSAFSSTWNIVLENGLNRGANDEGITIIPINGDIANMSEEDIEKASHELLSQILNEAGVLDKEEEEKAAEEEPAKLEFNELDKISKEIKKEVLCQDDVVDTIVNSFAVPAMGLRDETKPVRSIIAAGSTGVGKALHSETSILTPTGYKTVEDLNPGDTIFGGNGKTCKITAKYQPMTEDHYILSFSNGESIIACGDHLWTVTAKDGSEHTVDTRTLLNNVHSEGEQAYVVIPEEVNDDIPFDEKVKLIIDQDETFKSIYEKEGFEKSIELITREFCAKVNSFSEDSSNGEIADVNTPTVGSKDNPEGPLTDEHTPGEGLPDWYPIMPLKARLKASAEIIDNLENVHIEQSKKCTYVYFDIEQAYWQDLIKLFSTVGCVRNVDTVNSVNEDGNEILCFTVGASVAELSSLLNENSFCKTSFRQCRYVEIVSIEEVDERVVSKEDFYCFTVDSENALFLCGETNIPTHNTKLAYSLAANIYNKPVELFRIDMSEYADKHNVARLIGSPPGYHGFTEGGVLTNAIRQNPQAVILLDEMEKAHPDIANIFLQVLDAGRLTDGMGNTVDCSNNIFIFTTNLGVEERKKNGLGFSELKRESILKEDSTRQALKKFFRPEFLNRVDEDVVFNDISDGAGLIVRQEIGILREKMKKQGYTISRIPESIVEHVIAKSDFKNYGARDIQKVVRKEISEKVAREMLKGKSATTSTTNVKTVDTEKETLKKVSISVKEGSVVIKTR